MLHNMFYFSQNALYFTRLPFSAQTKHYSKTMH